MAQLTWRNIDAPDLTGAGNMMEQARKTVSGSLTGLSEILDKEAALQATNAKAAVQRNTQAGLNQIAQQYSTAAELEEALRNGGVQKIVDSYGGIIDESQLGAHRLRQEVTQLRQSDLNKLNFDEITRKIDDRAKFDSFLDRMSAGDLPGAIKFLEENDMGEFGKSAYDAIDAANKDKFERDKHADDVRLRGEDHKIRWGQLGVSQGQLKIAQADQKIRQDDAEYQTKLRDREQLEYERKEEERIATEEGQLRYTEAIADDEVENQQRLVRLGQLRARIDELGKAGPAANTVELENRNKEVEQLRKQMEIEEVPITKHQDAFWGGLLGGVAAGDRKANYMLKGVQQGRSNSEELIKGQDEQPIRTQTRIQKDIQNIDTKLNTTFAGSQLLAPMKDSDYVDAVLEDVTKSIDFTLTSNNVAAIKQSIAAAQEYRSFVPPKALAAVITAAVKDRDDFGTGLGKEAFEAVASQFAQAREDANKMFAQRQKLQGALEGNVSGNAVPMFENLSAIKADLVQQGKALEEAERKQKAAEQVASANGPQLPTLPEDGEVTSNVSAGQIPSSPKYNERVESLEKRIGAYNTLGGNPKMFVDELTRLSGLSESTNNAIENGITVTDEHRQKAKRVRRGTTLRADKIDKRADEIAKEEWIDDNKAFFQYLSTEQIKGLEKLGIFIDPKTRRLMD